MRSDIVATPSGKVLRASREFLCMVRRTRREVEGADILSITHPEDVAQSALAREHSLSAMRPGAILKRYIVSDGRSILVRVYGHWEQVGGGDVVARCLVTPVALESLANPSSLMAVNHRRYRVTVNRPRSGRDRSEWRLRVSHPCGRVTHELSGLQHDPGTREAALALARSREAALNGDRDPHRQTVGDVFEAYSAWSIENQAAGTARFTRNAIRWAERSGLSAVYVDGLNRRALSEARDLLWRELKANTAAAYWRRWRQAWSWAAERELVSLDWPQVRGKRLGPGDRSQKRALTDSEVADLLGFAASYATGRYQLLIWALAETGARIGELGAVDCSDFSRSGRIMLRETKTRAHRVVYVSPRLAERISADLVRGRTSGPVWVSARGGRIKDSSLEPLMTRWRRERGLMGEVDTHSLRRYAVSKLERSGVPQAAGRAVVGHSSAAVYARYADRGSYDLREACSALWLPCGHVSMPAVTLEVATQGEDAINWPTRIRTYSPRPEHLCGLQGERVHACPQLRALLRGVVVDLSREKAALLGALGVAMDP